MGKSNRKIIILLATAFILAISVFFGYGKPTNKSVKADMTFDNAWEAKTAALLLYEIELTESGENSFIQLTADIDLTEYNEIAITGNKTITLDLNGHTISRGRSIYYDENDECFIDDEHGHVISVGGYNSENDEYEVGNLILIDSSSDEYGMITGGYGYHGGIYVGPNSSFIMYNGDICGNVAMDMDPCEDETHVFGAGVYCEGTFEMYGGAIY